MDSRGIPKEGAEATYFLLSPSHYIERSGRPTLERILTLSQLLPAFQDPVCSSGIYQSLARFFIIFNFSFPLAVEDSNRSLAENPSEFQQLQEQPIRGNLLRGKVINMANFCLQAFKGNSDRITGMSTQIKGEKGAGKVTSILFLLGF